MCPCVCIVRPCVCLCGCIFCSPAAEIARQPPLDAAPKEPRNPLLIATLPDTILWRGRISLHHTQGTRPIVCLFTHAFSVGCLLLTCADRASICGIFDVSPKNDVVWQPFMAMVLQQCNSNHEKMRRLIVVSTGGRWKADPALSNSSRTLLSMLLPSLFRPRLPRSNHQRAQCRQMVRSRNELVLHVPLALKGITNFQW